MTPYDGYLLVVPEGSDYLFATSHYRDPLDEDKAAVNKLCSGIIRAISPGENINGRIVQTYLRPGQRVFYEAREPKYYEVNGEVIAFVNTYDVMAYEDVNESAT